MVSWRLVRWSLGIVVACSVPPIRETVAPARVVVELVPINALPADEVRPDVAAALLAERVQKQQQDLLRERFQDDAAAMATALDLFARTGSVASVIVEQQLDGGWRGPLHLVPEVPQGHYKRHLEWVRAALLDEDAFFGSLTREAERPLPYRWQPIELRFFRSVGQHRPSAYAEDWTVAYNVEGSLNVDADAVRELMFHETFHLNDAAHHDWSVAHLKATYSELVARCGTRVDCLAPFAPTETRVRGGTFYAFQPNNGEGTHEYAAELAVRYYREQRQAGRDTPVKAPFKCRTAVNAESWRLVVDEFFAGLDRVPACTVRGQPR